jgi:TonB family protein
MNPLSFCQPSCANNLRENKKLMTKRTNQIFLATFIALLTFVTVSGQGGSKSTTGNTSKTTAAPVQATPSDREQDGYNGPVMRVKSEVAKLINKNGRIIEGAKALFETYEYDMKGAKKSYTIDPGVITGYEVGGKETYKYDEKGNISEVTLLNADGSLARKEIFTYEYDFMDNWTKMTTFVAVFEDGKIKYEPTEVTQRTIKYFMTAELMDKYEKFEAQKTAANASAPTTSVPTPNLTTTSGTPATTTQPPKVDTKPDANHPNTTPNSVSPNSPTTNPSSTNSSPLNASNNKTGMTPSTPNNTQTETKPVQSAKSNNTQTETKPVQSAKSNNTQTETKPAQSANNTQTETKPAQSANNTQTETKPVQSANTKPDNANNQNEVKDDTTPNNQNATATNSEPPVSKPVKTFGRPISKGVLNGQALNLPSPDYPEFAKRARVQGVVKVEVVIDETGKVISAKAVEGPGMLQSSAVQAALRAKFSPTKLSEQAVKVTGTINYSFTLGN